MDPAGREARSKRASGPIGRRHFAIPIASRKKEGASARARRAAAASGRTEKKKKVEATATPLFLFNFLNLGSSQSDSLPVRERNLTLRLCGRREKESNSSFPQNLKLNATFLKKKKKNRLFLFFLSFFLSFKQTKSKMAKKPNVLIIWGDDIGISNLSCYSDGIMGYRTPEVIFFLF